MSEKWGNKPDLDEELDRLQARLPQKVSRFMKKVRSPEVALHIAFRPGIALRAGGLVGFLPIVGFWMGAARAPRCWRRTCRRRARRWRGCWRKVNGKRKSQS